MYSLSHLASIRHSHGHRNNILWRIDLKFILLALILRIFPIFRILGIKPGLEKLLFNLNTITNINRTEMQLKNEYMWNTWKSRWVRNPRVRLIKCSFISCHNILHARLFVEIAIRKELTSKYQTIYYHQNPYSPIELFRYRIKSCDDDNSPCINRIGLGGVWFSDILNGCIKWYRLKMYPSSVVMKNLSIAMPSFCTLWN